MCHHTSTFVNAALAVSNIILPEAEKNPYKLGSHVSFDELPDSHDMVRSSIAAQQRALFTYVS